LGYAATGSERGLECDEQLNERQREVHTTASLQLGRELGAAYLAFYKIVCMAVIYLVPLTREAMPMVRPALLYCEQLPWFTAVVVVARGVGFSDSGIAWLAASWSCSWWIHEAGVSAGANVGALRASCWDYS
jgi:hypothetical protein